MKRLLPIAIAAAIVAAAAIHLTGDRTPGGDRADVDRSDAGARDPDASALEDVEDPGAIASRRDVSEPSEAPTLMEAGAAETAPTGSGGRLLVRFTGSAAQADDATPGDAFRLVARGRADGDSFERDAVVDGDGEIVFTDLPSETAWRVVLTAERFIDRNLAAPLVAPGEVAVVEVPLERGLEISGRVVDDAGAPVPGARVSVSTWRHFDAALMPGRNAVVESDADGRFDAAGVEGGELSLRASAEGYLRGAVDLGRRANGESINDVVVRLDRGATVSGTVAWPDGAPAAGAEVRVAAPGRTWARARRTEADEDGRFELTGLSDSAWRVGAWLEHPEEEALWRATAELPGPGDVRLVLERGAALAGVVVDDADEPIGWASVSATPVGRAAGVEPVRARSDRESGAFALEGLGPGEWDVTAGAREHGEPASVTRVRVPLEDDALRIVLPRHGAIAGVLVDPDGDPITGAAIAGGGRTATTDADGRFALEDVAAGAVELEVAGTEVEYGPPREPTIALGPGERIEDLVVQLTRGGRILGEIHPSSFDGTEISVLRRPHDGYETVGATVDAEGRFTYEGVPPGRYRVSFDWMGKGDWVEGYRVRREVFVDVREGETTRVVLGDPGAYPIVVTGVVRDGGEPQEGLLMYVFDPSESQNQPLMVGRTDADGRYEVALPRSGPTLFTVGEGQQQQARFLRDLSDAPLQRFDLDLPGGTLQGRVVHEDGTPVTTRLVVLAHEDAAVGSVQLGDVQFRVSGADGSFRFDKLHPGRYRLRSGGYLRQNSTDALMVVEDVVVPDEGEAAPVELVAPDGAVLTVRAVGGSGDPIPGAEVEVLLDGKWPTVLFARMTTAYDGTLQFTGLPPGSATAVVLGADGAEIGRADVDLTAGGRQRIDVVCRGS